MKIQKRLCFAVLVFMFASPLFAGEVAGGRGILTQEEKNEELIKDAQNPIANMVSVPFQNIFNLGYGPHDKMQYVCNLQPVYPIGLPGKWTLITRNILPVILQPWPRNTGGLGDLTVTLLDGSRFAQLMKIRSARERMKERRAGSAESAFPALALVLLFQDDFKENPHVRLCRL